LKINHTAQAHRCLHRALKVRACAHKAHEPAQAHRHMPKEATTEVNATVGWASRARNDTTMGCACACVLCVCACVCVCV
jgi:hypothetical protein